MIFGGIQETTLIDFPGRVACVLFTAGCNFKCPYCHNPELLSFSTASVVRRKRIFEFLEERAGFLDGVVITGGEPTLHKDLPEFLASIREMGFEVKLDTNGSRPGVVRDIIESGLVDYIAMDLKTLPTRYKKMVASPAGASVIRSSIKAIINSGLPHEFRTTCAFPIIDEDAVERLGALVSGADLWVFQQCRGEKMLQPDFLDNAEKKYSYTDVENFARIASQHVKRVLTR